MEMTSENNANVFLQLRPLLWCNIFSITNSTANNIFQVSVATPRLRRGWGINYTNTLTLIYNMNCPLADRDCSWVRVNYLCHYNAFLVLVGQANLLVSVGGLVRRQCVLVAQSLTQECILGADFLAANDCVIDYCSKTLLAGGQLVPIHCRGQYPPVACTWEAVVMEDTCIPEQCEILIPVSLCRQWHEYLRSK